MKRPGSGTARAVALDVLSRAPGKRLLNAVLDEAISQAMLSPADARLTTHLVNGVIRRRATLDALIRPFIQRPLHNVEPWLMNALRMGAYQLAILTHIPRHAALYETVELAAEVGRPVAKRFLNGVLRRVAELVTDERISVPSNDTLPLEGGNFRRIAQPLLPDPATEPAAYLAAAMSWPRWLADRWLARFGWDEALRLGFWFLQSPPLWLRVNTLRTDRATLLQRFHQANIAAEVGSEPSSIKLTDAAVIRDLPGFTEGHFVVQDESAMRVAAALAPSPGQTVLDLCAAPGGKTTHLAELMQNEGRIVACDVTPDRLQTLETLAQRLGQTIIESTLIQDEPPSGPFDAALVDVPCSNTGVLGRRPEVRWRLRIEDFRNLVPLQTKLLIQAAQRVRPGSIIVYSTCSIEPEENQQVVRAVLKALRFLSLEDEGESKPSQPADGGYWARLRRR